MVIHPFEFQTNKKLVFGAGKVRVLPGLLPQNSRNILLLTGKSTFPANPIIRDIINEITGQGKTIFHESVHGEPSPIMVNELTTRYRCEEISAIIAIGGGSVVDAGKAVSAMLPLGDDVIEYLEGIGKKTHDGRKIFFIAVPTTAGTGSEATKNAVLSHIAEEGYKRSLRHPDFIPDIALVDPWLAVRCPAEITAASGMDAFTQLLESYVSPQASPLTDALAYSGMKMVKDALVNVFTNGNDLESRTAMAYAAYLSGVTLSNGGLGLAHGFASSIGGKLSIPHGIICGTLLGACVKETIQEAFRQEETVCLDKFARTGFLLSGSEIADINEEQRKTGCDILIRYLDVWTRTLKMPKLGDYGISHQNIDMIVNETDNKSNPVKLDKEAIKRILIKRT